jgi:hypothetical protein
MSNEERLTHHTAQNRHDHMGLADSALGGVTVAFLGQVFRLSAYETKLKLVN